MASDSLLWSEAFPSFFDYQQSLRASVVLLVSFSLITRDSDASLSLYPLVHDWCRDRMTEVEQQSSYRRAVSLLNRSVEWRYETEDYDFRRSLVSYVHACFRMHQWRSEGFDESNMQEWSTLAMILGENGWIWDALEVIE